MSSALSSLNSYDVVNLRTIINEEMAKYTDIELKCISKDVGFSPIWKGGILHGAHLILKFRYRRMHGAGCSIMVDYTIAVAGLTCRPSSSGSRGDRQKNSHHFITIIRLI